MTGDAGDTVFTGGIPDVYERLLVPMIFAGPAGVMASAVAALEPGTVLETAAGTGVLTRALRAAGVEDITATDLNGPMLVAAQALAPSSGVRWQVADALHLPFADGEFDVVACQFGVMFFPDKVRGYAEARRVLRPGGAFVFSVWDRIETSPVAQVVTDALCAAAPGESLDFLRRTPHGFWDVEVIRRDLAAARFADVSVDRHVAPSRNTAAGAAAAYCKGTPLRGHIEASSLDLERATRIATAALAERFGAEPFDAPIAWFQVSARPAPEGT